MQVSSLTTNYFGTDSQAVSVWSGDGCDPQPDSPAAHGADAGSSRALLQSAAAPCKRGRDPSRARGDLPLPHRRLYGQDGLPGIAGANPIDVAFASGKGFPDNVSVSGLPHQSGRAFSDEGCSRHVAQEKDL